MTHPSSDELEVSIFGRGFGECVLVHVGAARWVVVDSFRDPSGVPVALSYLESLLASAPDVPSIVAAVVTHWDDDHTKGMGDIVATYEPAQVWVPAVLNNDEAFEFAVTHEMAARGSPVPSGLKEFVALADGVDDARWKWAISGRDVETGTAATVRLLSPVDAVASRGFRALGIQQQPGFGEVASPKPNDTSIALWVQWDARAALLGADLEAGRWGWQAVVGEWGERAERADVLKVPHHGSPDAHRDEMFDCMCAPGALAAVTRYTPGVSPRPTEADRHRIRGRVGQGWVIGAHGPSRRQPSTPEELHEESITVDGLWHPRGPIGHVELRCTEAGQWTSQWHGSVEEL